MTKLRLLCAITLTFAFNSALFSQQRVDSRNTYSRLLCVVPMVGKGTWSDPKRPMYAPLPGAAPSTSRSGILGFVHQLSDDGQVALVEFVAKDRSAFRAILADT